MGTVDLNTIIKTLQAFTYLIIQVCFLICTITLYRKMTKREREEKKLAKTLKKHLKEAKRVSRPSLWQKILRKYYIYKEMKNSYGRLV